jgi:probable rRNA maturation factor
MDKKSSVEIEIQIAPPFVGITPVERLQATATATLRQEGIAGQATLVITDNEGIRQLNRAFLANDAPTDVLAFSAQEEAGGFVTSPEAEHYLGDVIVSYPRALVQAREVGHSVERELDLLIVHGILHLLGYDHTDQDEKAVMWARQEAILSNLEPVLETAEDQGYPPE